MKIVLFGATGMIGSRILSELLRREREVTVVARDPAKVPSNEKVKVLQGDVFDVESVASATRGADVVISAYGPPQNTPELFTDAVRSMIAGIKKSGAGRFVVVGGAGSLLVAPGVDLIDSGHLPEMWKPIAIVHRTGLAILRESGLNWTCLSPAAFIQPGERTGKFRLGGDSLVSDAEGNSRISAEDFAVALVDEVEHPKHERQRFTLAY